MHIQLVEHICHHFWVGATSNPPGSTNLPQDLVALPFQMAPAASSTILYKCDTFKNRLHSQDMYIKLLTSDIGRGSGQKIPAIISPKILYVYLTKVLFLQRKMKSTLVDKYTVFPHIVSSHEQFPLLEQFPHLVRKLFKFS